MLKIAALVEFCPPRLGSDRRIYELLTRLRGKHKVNFVVLPPGRALLGLIPLARQHKKETEVSLASSVKANYVSMPRLLWSARNSYLIVYALTFFLIWPQVLRIVKKTNADAVILNYPSAYTGLLGYLVGRVLRKTVVVDFNDIIAEYTMSFLEGNAKQQPDSAEHGISYYIVRSVLVAIQNYIVKHSDLATALTTYTINYSKRLRVRDDITLVPDGVDTELFDPHKFTEQDIQELRNKYEIRTPEKVALYVGRLEKWAGVDMILGCAKLLKDSNVRFLLAGEGSLKPVGDLSNVILTGRIPHDSVPRYLASADLVLVPMQQGALGQSASPLKLFEAMAMGKPIIASNTTGISDAIINNVEGIMLPQDEILWSKAIERILENSAEAFKLGKNARARIEREFDWNLLASKFIKLVLVAVDEKTRRN